MECCRTHVAGCHLVDNVIGAEWEGWFDGGEMGTQSARLGKTDNTLHATFTDGRNGMEFAFDKTLFVVECK